MQIFRCLPVSAVKLTARRGFRVPSRPHLIDATGSRIGSSRHSPFGGCSCGMCSVPARDGKDGEADTLKAALDKNVYLEDEIAKLRLQMSRGSSPFQEEIKEDPDISILLENNKKWVADQQVRARLPRRPRVSAVLC